MEIIKEHPETRVAIFLLDDGTYRVAVRDEDKNQLRGVLSRSHLFASPVHGAGAARYVSRAYNSIASARSAYYRAVRERQGR